MHPQRDPDPPPGKPLPSTPPARAANLWAQCGLVLLAALISLAIQLVLIPMVGMGPGFESVSLAKTLATRGEFADPFDGPTGPTAHLAPAFPFLLASVYRATANEEQFRIVTLLLTILFHLLNVLLLYLLARDLFPGTLPRSSILAIALVTPLYQVIPAEDAIYVSTGVLAFWLLCHRKKLVLSGLLGGIMLLFNPSLFLVFIPVAAYEWRSWKSVGLFLAILLLVVSPWEARDYRVFHRLFFIRDNLGLELDVYNNDCEDTAVTGCTPHPIQSAAERAKIQAMGEASYNAMRMRHAIGWFASHPARAATLVAQRVAGYWFPVSAAKPFGYAISVVTGLSILGLWFLWRDRAPVLWPMVAIFLIYPLVYYLVRFDLRYRYSILWLSIIAAGYGIARVIRPMLASTAAKAS